VARAATTSDAFNAVAEPRRRAILSYLAWQERPVGEIVESLRLEQPSVSKHLRVLLEVGTFERFWRHQLNRVREHAEGKIRKVESDMPPRRNHDYISSKD
jgi:DNA-binding transcriptional ArsR family regulator